MHPISAMKTKHHQARFAKPALALATAATLCLGLLSASTLAAQAATDVKIDILGINDFHGRLEADGTAVAGAAVLAGAVDQYRAANPNTLFVSAGDSLGASTFTSFIQKDKPTLDALNEMKLDASALGNHEFDKGRADVDGRIIPAAKFPYLAANLYDNVTGLPAYDTYSVSVVDGIRVGFIGAVTEALPTLVDPTSISTLDVRGVVPEVNRVADQLSDGNAANGEADVVVLLVHEGATTPDVKDATDASAFGKIVTGVDANVDAIFSAHTHQSYQHALPVSGWPAGVNRPVVQGGEYGGNLAQVSLTVDKATKQVTATSSALVALVKTPPFPKNAAVDKIVKDAAAVAEVKGSVTLGTITADLKRALQSDGKTENRGGESTLGNFVADVQLWATAASGSQIALMNAGGLRNDISYASSRAGDPDGNVTYREAAAVQPFANTLVTLDYTGAQIKKLLEEQWQPTGASRPFIKLGISRGFEYLYDPAAAKGSHIIQMTLNGAPIEDTATYKVAVNSFLSTGKGDNFVTFKEGKNKADSGKVDLEAMVDYFASHPTVSPDYVQRAVGATLSAPDANGYTAGDAITMKLSSLAFSAGEPAPKEVEVLYGGSVIGKASIDPTAVTATDEVGRATLNVTLPSGGEAGRQAFTVRVPDTGTEITVPIDVAVLPPVIRSEGLGDANAGAISISPSVARPGDTVRISLPGRNESTVKVISYDPFIPLGATTVSHGSASVRLPAGMTAGTHKIAVYAGDGSVVGWAEITVVAKTRTF